MSADVTEAFVQDAADVSADVTEALVQDTAADLPADLTEALRKTRRKICLPT